MLTFRDWYRILRSYYGFSIHEAITFARWLSTPSKPVITKAFEYFHGKVN